MIVIWRGGGCEEAFWYDRFVNTYADDKQASFARGHSGPKGARWGGIKVDDRCRGGATCHNLR